jgi:hypothetical protein
MLLAVVILKEHEYLSMEFYLGASLIIFVLVLNAWLNKGKNSIP